MKDSIVSDYVPNAWQAEMHADGFRHGCLTGGKGCLRESTPILTKDGLVPLGDIRGPQVYWSWDGTRFRLSPGSAPFLKGKANLYRVVHEQGEFVASAQHRALCVDGSYRQVQQMQVGMVLIGADPASVPTLQPTRTGAFLSGLPLDVQHYLKKFEDWMGRCLVGIHQYGLQPQFSLNTAQAFFPRQDGAPLFSPFFSQGERRLLDEQSLGAPRHSRLGLFGGQSSMMCFEAQGADPLGALACRISSIFFGRTSLSAQAFEQLQKIWFSRQRDFLLQPPSHSLSPKKQLTKILSIERLPKEEFYFDLQVPGDNNYVAEGVVHHNSGKTRAGIEELIACALEFPGSAYLIGRKTLPSLKDSTWREFNDVLPRRLVSYSNKAEREIRLINGSYFIGRSLDEPKKFESLKLTGFLLDEADENERMVYDTLKTRVRQKIDGLEPRYRTLLLLNPCEEDHWIPRLFIDEKPPMHKIFFSSTLDNLSNLPSDYVEELKRVYTPDMQERMIFGRFGRVHKGRPVFPQFSRGNYIFPIEPIQQAPIFRCIDFGYNNPACVWMQWKNRQFRILASIRGDKIYLDDFIKTKIFPLEEEIFANWPYGFKEFCDPAGSQESDKGKTSVQILREHGMSPLYSKTTIEEGIKIIKESLETKNSETGEPNFVIHPRCKNLIEGLRGGYHRADNSEDPVKDGYYDHEIDAMRYGVINLFRRYKSGDAAQVFESFHRIIHPRTGRVIEF